MSWAAISSGDVVGPASSTDNALARFDLATGKLLQNSTGILTDAGALSGLTSIDATGAITLTKSSAIILGLASAAGQVSSTGTIAISSDGLGVGADTRSGFLFTGRNTSGTVVNILELSGATGATVTKSLSVGGATPSTSGAGITFPATQSASSDANTLDDYEEGTWTPTVNSMTTTGSPAYSGRYRKIGSQVTVWFFTTTAGGVATYASTAGSTNVSGMPFNSAYDGPAASGGPPGTVVNGVTTAGGFLQGPSSGAATFYFNTAIAASQGMSASLTYYTT
jgi:hypothetical protein